jgi:hypothetical protein
MMKRPRLGALAIGLLTACGLGLGLACSASATPSQGAQSARATAGAASPVRMVVFDCPGQPAVVRPGTFILACADGNAQLTKLSWTGWTSRVASAYGMLYENDCNPSCVGGHFHSYPALVILWGDAAVKNHPGEHHYTMLTQILTGPRPRYYDYATRKWVTAPVTQTIPLSAINQ